MMHLANRLCLTLAALYDKAFDAGLMTVDEELQNHFFLLSL